MTEAVLIDRFANALGRKEGWQKKGSVAQRLNNPVCMTHWKNPDGEPFPEVNGYVNFPDPETGWRAARAQCRINIIKRRLTWREFFGGKPGVYKGFRPYAADKLDPVEYARTIMNYLQVEPHLLDTPIISLVVRDVPVR